MGFIQALIPKTSVVLNLSGQRIKNHQLNISYQTNKEYCFFPEVQITIA